MEWTHKVNRTRKNSEDRESRKRNKGNWTTVFVSRKKEPGENRRKKDKVEERSIRALWVNHTTINSWLNQHPYVAFCIITTIALLFDPCFLTALDDSMHILQFLKCNAHFSSFTLPFFPCVFEMQEVLQWEAKIRSGESALTEYKQFRNISLTHAVPWRCEPFIFRGGWSVQLDWRISYD